MKRSQWVTVPVVVLATSVFASPSARAQVSDERIRELMKQAAELDHARWHSCLSCASPARGRPSRSPSTMP